VGTPGVPEDDYVDARFKALTYMRGNVGADFFFAGPLGLAVTKDWFRPLLVRRNR
jgi:hypothetical protein